MCFLTVRKWLSLCRPYLVYLGICVSSLAMAQPASLTKSQQKLAELEAAAGGRIGVAAVNTANGTRLEYRAQERFPLGSTNKVMGVAAILRKSMEDHNLLAQKVVYTKQDLVTYSPVTEKHLTDGMTISELCAATITQSDNTAINLLMKKLGGPKAVTAFARSIGDHKFRLDRWEPELNSAIPGDLRDTTTPDAMLASLERLLLGNVLGITQKQLLQKWLKENTTGNARIRAGVPKGWLVGDKTGTSDYGTTNDIAIIWPPKAMPIIVAIYFTQKDKNAAPQNEVIAKAARIILDAL